MRKKVVRSTRHMGSMAATRTHSLNHCANDSRRRFLFSLFCAITMNDEIISLFLLFSLFGRLSKRAEKKVGEKAAKPLATIHTFKMS